MRQQHWYDYITINIYWLGLTMVSQSNGLILPLQVQKFVGSDQQGTAYGNLRLYTLMIALLVQALMGMLSDHSTMRWGRRRPFILIGTLLNMGALLLIGASPSYSFLFGAVVFSQFASNIAHAAEQGLIPDLIPESQRGRFSGAKAVMELLPVIIVAFSVGKLIEAGQMWAGILVASSVLFLAMAITMFVREDPLREDPGPLDWQPFARLVAMTLVFLIIILGLGAAVKGVGTLLIGADTPLSPVIVMAVTGLIAMTAAVGLGVWTSVRISIGAAGAKHAPSFPWWVINRLAFFVGTTNLSTFAIYFIQGRLGVIGEKAAGPATQLMMIVGLLILVCALPSGWLSDRIGRQRLIALSGLAAALGTLIIIMAQDITVMYIGGGFIGAATGTFFTTNWALGTDLVPREEAGRYLGISNLAGAGAGAVGAYIGGPIADYFTVHVPESPGLGYGLIFAIYAAMFLISAAVIGKVQEDWRGPD